MRQPILKRHQVGFTMVELLVAMAVFSFLLLIVSVGFINVVRINSQAVASNIVQDSAKAAIDEVVRGVRNSVGVNDSPAVPTGRLCLDGGESGNNTVYYLKGGQLIRSDDCFAVDPTYKQQITSDDVKVVDFTATTTAPPVGATKSEVQISITVTSANGIATFNSVTNKYECGPTNQDRAFCSVVTLTSGAVPR